MKQESDTTCRFDPTLHEFVLLPDHLPPGNVRFYEYRNHVCVDGKPDHHRLNVYLTQDGPFVTIWFGLLDNILAETLFRNHGMEPVNYDEPLFRGYIEFEVEATHILKALRIDRVFPQRLRSDPIKGIVCDPLEA
jgi:hypothetical protein